MTKTNISNSPKIIPITAIAELAIANYFATINQENFTQTAALFAEAGELHAPFEQPIVGRKAIAAYLDKEAKKMQLVPQTGRYESTEGDLQQIKVQGKVKTPFFSVNVAWYFHLDREQQITIAKIKLLASPQELLGLKQAQDDR